MLAAGLEIEPPLDATSFAAEVPSQISAIDFSMCGNTTHSSY